MNCKMCRPCSEVWVTEGPQYQPCNHNLIGTGHATLLDWQERLFHTISSPLLSKMLEYSCIGMKNYLDFRFMSVS